MMRWILLAALTLGAKHQDAPARPVVPVQADPTYQTAGKRKAATERRVALRELRHEPSVVFLIVKGELHNLGPRLGPLKVRLVCLDQAGKPLTTKTTHAAGLVAGGVWKFKASIPVDVPKVARVLVHAEDRQGPIPCVASD